MNNTIKFFSCCVSFFLFFTELRVQGNPRHFSLAELKVLRAGWTHCGLRIRWRKTEIMAWQLVLIGAGVVWMGEKGSTPWSGFPLQLAGRLETGAVGLLY